jgi:cytochrome P450
MTLALQYDPLALATLADPYPIYATMRAEAPIFWHEQMQSWVLSRYQDCVDVFRNHEVFARDWRRVGEAIPQNRQSVQSVDPSEQGSLFMNAFHAQNLDAIGVRARAQLEQLFDGFGDRGFELTHEVAAPVSLAAISALLGIEQSELSAFSKLSEALARRMDVVIAPEAAGPGDMVRIQLNEIVDSWFRGADRLGMVADVMRTRANFDVAEHYVRNTTGVMYNAAYSTIYATTGNIVLTILQNPEVLDQIDGPGLLETAVDEMVRFDGPTQGTSRVATTDFEIGGTAVRAGEVVLPLLAAANRDPDQFADPDRLVLDRSPNKHLGFGWGLHACMGARLANVVLRELIAVLRERPVRLRLTAEPIRRHTATLRCIEELPVAFST